MLSFGASLAEAAPASQALTNLIILCCHAIFLGSEPYSESHWRLAPFQESTPTRPGEHETFLLHLRASLAALTQGSWAENSLLVISGGCTSPDESHPSEAASYFAAATALGGEVAAAAKKTHAQGRLVLEEHATDSYQNVLFSVMAFRRHVGRYPKNIRIVTHAFKSDRFTNLHARAIKWPAHRFAVLGINPVATPAELDGIVAAEHRNGYAAFAANAYGSKDPVAWKRRERGWSEDTLSEIEAGIDEDEVRALLRWNGEGGVKEAMFKGFLPWETDGEGDL